jgi:hypothetical protein
MKHFSLLLIFTCILSVTSFAQVSISSDGAGPDNSAMLDVKSTNKGLLIPRMTRSQIAAIADPANGLVVFCTDENQILTFIGNVGQWEALSFDSSLKFGCGVDSTMVNTGIKLPMGYSQGIIIDTIVFIATAKLSGTQVNVTPKLFYGPDISATGTAIITSPSPVTSTSTATKVCVFNHDTIAKGNIIWLTFSAVSIVPRNFMVQILGHKQ